MRLLLFLFVLYMTVSVFILENGENKLSSIVYKPKTFSKKAFFQLCRVRRKIKQKCKKNTTKLLIQQLLILSGTVERNPGPWTCSRCSQVFRHLERYQNHLQNQELVSCQHCDKDFCRTDRCRTHERNCPTNHTETAAPTTPGSWTCRGCSQTFKEYPRFQKHL